MNILLADDHAMVRDTISAFLTGQQMNRVTGCATLQEAEQALEQGDGTYDIVLLDLNMPGMDGVSSVRDMVTRVAPVPVAVITGSASAHTARQVLEAGAQGFFPKTLTAKSLEAAIQYVVAGQVFMPYAADALTEKAAKLGLSAREIEVLERLCEGKANRVIAEELDLKEVTIKLYVKTLCRKLEVANRTQAALKGRDLLSA